MSHHGLGVHEESDMDRAFVSELGPREKPVGGFKPNTINIHICRPAAEVEVCGWPLDSLWPLRLLKCKSRFCPNVRRAVNFVRGDFVVSGFFGFHWCLVKLAGLRFLGLKLRLASRSRRGRYNLTSTISCHGSHIHKVWTLKFEARLRSRGGLHPYASETGPDRKPPGLGQPMFW